MVKSDLRVSSNSEVSSTLKQRERDREASDGAAPMIEPSLHQSQLWLQICSSALPALDQEQPKLVSLSRALQFPQTTLRLLFKGPNPSPHPLRSKAAHFRIVVPASLAERNPFFKPIFVHGEISKDAIYSYLCPERMTTVSSQHGFHSRIEMSWMCEAEGSPKPSPVGCREAGCVVGNAFLGVFSF